MEELEDVKQFLPSYASVSELKYEGSDIVIYTDSEKFFLNNSDTVKEIVSELKKRVEIRPSSKLYTTPEKAKKKVKELVSDEAGVEEVIMQPSLGKMIIRAEKPGEVIGNRGSGLDEIKEKTLWSPQVERVPAIDSKVVDRARELTVEDPEFRKEFLHDVGKKIRLDKSVGDEWVRVSALGGCRQVGRSCFLLQTEESNVLLDAGIDPAAESGTPENFPYLNAPELDLKQLDAVVLSHAHMDHCGMIPYLFKMGYDGPVYCTEPTRDMMIMLTLDYIGLAHSQNNTAPYDSTAIKKAVKRTITPDYGEVTDITPDMRLTLENAGHIIGSSLCHIHVGEGLHNLLYTGDYNYDNTEMLREASTDFQRVETMITESTYGGRDDEQTPREEANKKFLSKVKQTLNKGGKVIVPAFAVGRSQEVLGLLADEMERSYFDYPVYIDGMIKDANALHTAYPEFLSKKVQKKIFEEEENPFLQDNIKAIGSHNERKEVFDEGPCVILTTSGSITGGPVLSYLQQEADNPDNALIFVGYQFAGSLGRKIQDGADQIEINGKKVDVNLDVNSVSGFSAHSDREQIIDFAKDLRSTPNRIFTNHGEEKNCYSLASALHKILHIDTSAPQNLEAMRLE
ncbi:beta-CASP ribonuclease aCPSF1 [Candidatus Nanohalobium constans]|uniref:Transcription termination factor FttA n=1 Tax=Candidatus Nanohalobium constans TaxID=2565781 RepID=A0A5Q0UFL8_9ARCH|nr:beta-CASP ribonuclease aCPSF1 [Candidatus Nanohalobium constans]QGA80376.1 putative metal-dependent RNase [Candidatus Nanohalobium constans]